MKMNIRNPITRALLLFAAWMVFGFALVQSVTVAVEWWQGRLAQLGPWEWLWLVLLPVLIVVWLRYFSIFRPGCSACALPAERGRRGMDP